MGKDLSEKDQIFLDCLFNVEVNPELDPKVAHTLAGYDKSETLQKVIRRLHAEYRQEAQNYALSLAHHALQKLNHLVTGNAIVPNADKVHKAATELLDRAGITKKDRQEVEISSGEGVLILPPIKYNES
jgi:hypothetical protein